MRITPPVPQRSFSTMTADRQLHTPVTRTYSPSLPDRPGSRAYSMAPTLFDGSETQTAYSSNPTFVDPGAEPHSRSASPAPTPMFSSAMPMEDDREMKSDTESQSRNPSRSASRAPSVASSSRQGQRRPLTLSNNSTPIFVVASLYEFNIDKQRREGGFPYLTYVQGEIFDVYPPFSYQQTYSNNLVGGGNEGRDLVGKKSRRRKWRTWLDLVQAFRTSLVFPFSNHSVPSFHF